jgi:serine/threonine protein kinase/WD40 repeat protein
MTQRFQPPSELPAPFGRYNLLKLLGQGGMGSVYLALDTQLDRRVALKTPLFDTADGSQILERFYREARAAATVHHPNICPIYDVGECNGVPYLTMAFIDGKPLADFAGGNKPPTPRQSALLVRKLALALSEAHQHKVIHRDLKPANIMVDRRSEPIVMDFGLARRSQPGDVRMTQEGATLGTPAYMPPEQVSGNVDLMGPASDIYSLGVILYELLAGRLPFSGDVMAMLSQVLMDEPPPPSKFRPGIDPELDAICRVAMAKKIPNRYGSMKEMATALQDYLRQEMPATPARVPPQAVATLPEAPAKPQTEGIRVSALGGMRSMDQAYQELPKRPAAEPPRPAKRKRSQRKGVPWGCVLAILSVAGILGLGSAGLALFLIFQPATDGTRRLELEPADAAVKIEVDGVPDHHHGDLLRLRPGEHRITIYGKDWVSVHQPFQVKSGDNEPLFIKLVRAAATASAQAEEIRQIRWDGGVEVFTAALSADGQQCLVSGAPDTARLYDVKTGKELYKFAGIVAAFRPGSKEIVTAGRSKGQTMIRVYSAGTGFLLREFGVPDDLWNLRLSPAGDCALVVGPAAYRLVNLETKQAVFSLNCDMNLSSAIFAPDGKHLLCLGSGKLPWQVFDCTNPKSQADFAKKNATPPKDGPFKNILNRPKLDGFFPDGRRVFVRTDNYLNVYDVTNGSEKRITLGKDIPDNFLLGPSGLRALASYKDHTVRLWELSSERELCRFPTALEGIRILAFSGDGRYACAAGAPGLITVWRLPDTVK